MNLFEIYIKHKFVYFAGRYLHSTFRSYPVGIREVISYIKHCYNSPPMYVTESGTSLLYLWFDSKSITSLIAKYLGLGLFLIPSKISNWKLVILQFTLQKLKFM